MPDPPLRVVFHEMTDTPAFPTALHNVCSKLPGVPVTIVNGTGNREATERAIAQAPPGCVTQVTTVDADGVNVGTLSTMWTTPDFWDNLGVRPGEKVLTMQSDAGICGPGDRIHDFTEYDYCGAPWPHRGDAVGNGGFSVRNPALMRKYSQQAGPTTEAEDVFFSRMCEADPECRVCPLEVAQAFSTELSHHPGAFGFHKNWNHEPICPLNETIKRQYRQGPSRLFVSPPDDWAWVQFKVDER
jgi:hypothetical protein